MRKITRLVNNKRTGQRLGFLALIVFLGLVVGACVSTIINIDQPGTVVAGDTAHIVLDIQWKETNFDQNMRQVIGICMPKGWDAGNNTKMYLTSEIGDANMSKVPPGAVDPSTGLLWSEAFSKKFGIGPNLIDDMEWIVYWSDVKFFVANQSLVNAKVHINIKTGPDNLMFKPGFAMCEDGDGLSDGFPGYYTSAFGKCLEVLDGEGDIIDFCNPQIGIGEPSNATDNDLITIRYNGTLDETALKNESDVFWCATAYTTSGETIEICAAEDFSKMRKVEDQKWRIDIWPRKYFNLNDNQTLARIEYYFIDRTGGLKTGYGNTADPFKFTFKCK